MPTEVEPIEAMQTGATETTALNVSSTIDACCNDCPRCPSPAASNRPAYDCEAVHVF